MILAVTYTTAQVVSNLYYTNIVFSLLISMYLFDNDLTAPIALGMMCIVLGGIGIIYFQTRRKLVLSAQE